AIPISALVAVVLKELVNQMTVSSHDLDAVEAASLRVDGGNAVSLDDSRDLRCLQRPVRRRLRKAVRSHNENIVWICPIGRIDRSRDRFCARHRNMSRAPSVPERSEYVAALGMDRIRDAFPACHLLVVVESWCTFIATPRCRDRRRFRENYPAVRCTLPVIFELQIAWDAARPLRSKPTHRRHHDAMLECDRPDLYLSE